MIEKIIRNLDHKTSKSLALTIKAVLADHIRFIRELNRILILRRDDGDALAYTKRSIAQHHFKRWFEPFEASDLASSQDFNAMLKIHDTLQYMAKDLANSVTKTGSIDIEQYEKFLALNDNFFELLWQLATEVIAAQYQFDSLTKLLNRRFFEPILKHELSRVKRQRNISCLVLIDIDDFKQINDNYGHDVGDTILSEFASLITASIRENDYASRHGGEELLICLPDTDLAIAEKVIVRLLSAIALFSFSLSLKLTASCGIAQLIDDVKQSTINADQAMYAAKAAGKNQVKIFQVSPNEQ